MNKNEIMLEVKKIIKKHNLKAPVDLNKVLKKEEIELKKIDKSKIKENKNLAQDGEIWAFLIPKNHPDFKNPKTVILISSIIKYPNSIRFTVAHELGHYFLDGQTSPDIVYRKKFVSNPDEYKYNQFAINLLIPDKEEFRKKRINMDKYDLARYYGLPIAAVEIFIEELND